MNITKYLDYLVKRNYIVSYTIADKYFIISYSLLSTGNTERSIECDSNADIHTFIESILNSARELKSDIYNCLVSENDFFGYSSKEELDNRILEEEEYLYYIADKIKVLYERGEKQNGNTSIKI